MILYVVEFDNRVIKVGTTSKTFNERLEDLQIEAQPLKVTRTYHCLTWIEEQRLIRFCKLKGRISQGREWFEDILFEDIVEFLQNFEQTLDNNGILPLKRKKLKARVVTQLKHKLIENKKKRLHLAKQKQREDAKIKSAEYKKCQPVRTPTPPKQMPWICSLHRHKEFSRG